MKNSRIKEIAAAMGVSDYYVRKTIRENSVPVITVGNRWRLSPTNALRVINLITAEKDATT